MLPFHIFLAAKSRGLKKNTLPPSQVENNFRTVTGADRAQDYDQYRIEVRSWTSTANVEFVDASNNRPPQPGYDGAEDEGEEQDDI